MELNYSSNSMDVLKSVMTKLQTLAYPDTINTVLRTIATSIRAMIKDRVHTKGLAADGTPIGTYSPSYLEYRVNKFNRTRDPKVVLSLTRYMENDLSVIANGDREYAIGYLNASEGLRLKESITNEMKAKKLEEKYGKKIFALSKEEKEVAQTIAVDYVKKLLAV